MKLECKFLLNYYVLGLYLTKITSGTTTWVYKTWRPIVRMRHLILWGSKVRYWKLRLTSKILLNFNVLGLYLTGIASRTFSQIYETWRPVVQILRLVLWGNKIHCQKLRLTSRFLLKFNILRLYLTAITSGTTSWGYEKLGPTVWTLCLVLWINKVHHHILRLKSKFLL